MAQPYVGEIRMFAGNFAPAGWMFCEGQLLPISENDVLFVYIGTRYGGDGQETFALPDLRARIPIHQGAGFIIGETGGVEEVTLSVNQIPGHRHVLVGSGDPASARGPGGGVFGGAPARAYASAFQPQAISPQTVTAAGGSQPHTNLQPYLCVNFIISLFGIIPQPS